MFGMERPMSSTLNSIIDDYVAKPLPPLPLDYSRSSSVYSQDSALVERREQQDESDLSVPEQIYLQPTRFCSSTSKLPVPKFALYEQPQHSTLSLRLKPKLEENNTTTHRAASYSKPKPHEEGGSHLGRRDRSRGYLLPRPDAAQAAKSLSQGNRPLSRFSSDSDSDEDVRSKAKDSLISYLSQLSTPRRERAVKSGFSTAQQSSKRASSAPTSFQNVPDVERGKDKSYWPRISLASLLHSGRESNGRRFILPNRARRPSGPDTPHLGRDDIDWRSHPLAAGALASIQRGTTKLRSGMEKARKKVTGARAKRKNSELKSKIRVIGEADQFPDGRVNWWI